MDQEGFSIEPINIAQEMKNSYLDYAMSVIVSRAIPDVRDGLKPVHRRILYAMNESGCYSNKPYRRSARIVGDVMGKYHPHGDVAIYDSLVRMAQDFSLLLPLVDGQGNFGSIDGDSPAAMRYTESRMAKSAHYLIEDIDKSTVEFQDNYDNSEREPTVLPARFPNLLVNGGGGIAVGMATNIPPFNLGEVVDACCEYIKDHSITIDRVAEIVQGPDFPTAGMILGTFGANAAVKTGRGSVLMRGKASVETNEKTSRQTIIITEIPYMVNKARMVEKIAELVRDKKIEGISDLRDESDKSGIRVVVEVKRDAVGEVILNQLYKFTPLQTSFGVNMLALNNGRPEVMNVLDVIKAFVEFREEVVSRRAKFLLDKARNKAHVLIGLFIAVQNIDKVIELIKKSPNVVEAKQRLLETEWFAKDIEHYIALVQDRHNKIVDSRCRFTEAQAKAILEMRLQKLTGIEQENITKELGELAVEIKNYIEVLGSREKLLDILLEELQEVKEEFAVPRKTQIEQGEFEYDMEDLITREDMVVTVTHKGYAKRVPLDTYRAQRRGGKGRSALAINEDDFTTELFVANTHAHILFFSNQGKVYKIKVYKLPLGSTQSKGRALINILPLAEGEKITSLMSLPEDEKEWEGMNIMFATSKGKIRRNSLEDFYSIQSNGKIAIRLDETDDLVAVRLCKEDNHIMLSAKSGKCLRFPVNAVRVFKSRTSDGVRGIKLAEGDKVVSMSVLNAIQIDFEEREKYLRIPLEERIKISSDINESGQTNLIDETQYGLTHDKIMQYALAEEFILSVTENGFGKRTSAYEYRVTNRGGQGIVNIVTSPRNGPVISSFPIDFEDQIMLITDHGTVIRCPIHDIRIAGRNTQGVTIFRTAEKEKIVSIAQLPSAKDDEEMDGEDLGGEEVPSEEGSIDAKPEESNVVESTEEGSSEESATEEESSTEKDED
jgi:DNA gyrase subunit A